MVASLEQLLDLNKTSFEDIVGRLKAYEERVAEDEETQEDQGKLMYLNSDSQSNREYNGGNRGNRGRGGRTYGRGRGCGRWSDTRDASKITCYRCDKLGHYTSSCPDRLLKLQEVQESEAGDTQGADELMMHETVSEGDDTQRADALMLHEIVYLNEEKVLPSKYEENTAEGNMWYLDNGASNHMTGDRRYFSVLN